MPERKNHYSGESDICADDEHDDSSTSYDSNDSDFIAVVFDCRPRRYPEEKAISELDDLPPVEEQLINVKEELRLFKSQLTSLKQEEKDSNASWEFNKKPPQECLDSSDDEGKSTTQERIAKVQNWILSNETHKSQCSMSDPYSHQDSYYNNRSSFNKNNVTIATDSRTVLPSRVCSAPPSPPPPVSSVSAALFTSISNSSCSSPSPSYSSALISSRHVSFSSPCPLAPSPPAVQRNSPFSFPPSSATQRYSPSSVTCSPCPPSASPSICSQIPSSMQTQAQNGNFSTPKQPYVSPSQRSFSIQNAPQGVSMQPAKLQPHVLRTVSPNRLESPFLLQSHQQSYLQRFASHQSVIKQSIMPLQTVIRGSAFPLQNVIQRSSLQLPQRSVFPSALAPHQTHSFGQVTFMNNLLPLQPSLPLSPPPINICRHVPPPFIPINSFSSINSQMPSNHHSLSHCSHVPPSHPLTIEIPNLSSSSVPFNHYQTDQSGSSTTLPIRNNML